MALVSCVLWVAIGVFYIIYKLGEDASDSKAGGIGCAILVALGLYVFYLIANFSMDLVIGLALVGIIIGFSYLVLRGIKEAYDPINDKEQHEIRLIRAALPMPTDIQLQLFLKDIRSEKKPSVMQDSCLVKLKKAERGFLSENIREECFKDMQAAWIYYSQHDSKSTQRWLYFKNQELSMKSYFAPSKE